MFNLINTNNMNNLIKLMENLTSLEIYAICITAAFVILSLLVIFRKIGRPLSEAEAMEKIKRRQEREEYLERQYQIATAAMKNQEETIKNLKAPVLYLSSTNDDFGDKIVLSVQDGEKKTHVFQMKRKGDMERYPFFASLYQTSRHAWYHSKNGEVIIP